MTAAANVEITIRFGAGNTLTRSVPATTTVGDIVRNKAFQAALGYGENVTAYIDEVEQSLTTTVRDGDEVSLETKANSKAAAI